jgi:hypothetical protein
LPQDINGNDKKKTTAMDLEFHPETEMKIGLIEDQVGFLQR